MLDWKQCIDELPESGKDVIAFSEQTHQTEIGIRSSIDTEVHEWVDFSFEVTHWAYFNFPSGIYDYIDDFCNKGD